MGLDVDTPDPPDLRGPQGVGDYDSVEETEDAVGDDARRENLATFLREGAWERAFGEWADHTALDEDDVAFARRHDLFEGIDLYWNPAAGDVGYRAPAVPDRDALPADDRERFGAGDLGAIADELDDLARTVTEVLEAEYVDPDEEGYGAYAGDDGGVDDG